jgi:hypothetical protein
MSLLLSLSPDGLLMLLWLLAIVSVVVMVTVVKSTDLVVDKGDLTNSELIYC